MDFPLFAPYSPATNLGFEIVDQHYRPPRTQTYSLNLQTGLGHNLLLEIGYVGSRGDHLIVGHNIDQPLLASESNPIRGVTTNTIANIPLRLPIPGFNPTNGGLFDIDSLAVSRYNALQVSLTRRLSRRLQFLAAYTFSHAYSDAGANTSAAGGGQAGDQVNLMQNYGRSDFNRAHRFIISYILSFGNPEKLGRFLNSVLGGWSWSGVTTIQSGLPLILMGRNANNVYGWTTDRVQIAPGCTYSQLTNPGSTTHNLNSYFNTGCISNTWPVVGADGMATAFGNSGVGIVFGPGQHNFDMALIKRHRLGILREGSNLEFRAEAFNVI